VLGDDGGLGGAHFGLGAQGMHAGLGFAGGGFELDQRQGMSTPTRTPQRAWMSGGMRQGSNSQASGTRARAGSQWRTKRPLGSWSRACLMGLYTRVVLMPVVPACICIWLQWMPGS
jgi:hypothetical protein